MCRFTTIEVCWVVGEWIVPNKRIRDLSGVTKRMNEKIDGSLLRWFGHIERMGNNRIAERIYLDECIGGR